MHQAQLTDFVATAPRYQLAQADSLAWLADAHAEAAQLLPPDRAALHARLTQAFARCGCPPSKIRQRGFEIDLGAAFAGHPLYDVTRRPRGASTEERTRLFGALVDAYFATAFAEDAAAPDELIHVTCTGYLSPSPAQKLVAARGWSTRVTHAYQMGCYAAIPAVRLAQGALRAQADAGHVEIVHTELCSLHLDPSRHALDQLVIHSLFADGLIRYAVVPDAGDRPGLRVRAIHELIVPGTAQAMTWAVGDAGMEMTLGRDVPALIASVLRPFVQALLHKAGLTVAALGQAAVAVHPGGPKIIDLVRATLELTEAQVATSRAVLLDHGNMSSATLPHVWMRMLADPAIPRGTLIPSLAFGPGLTVCGALLEKR